MLTRRQRLAWWLGTISATFLAVEIVIIAGAAVIGTTSHFNVTTPVSTTLWSIMGTSIVIVWAAAHTDGAIDRATGCDSDCCH